MKKFAIIFLILLVVIGIGISFIYFGPTEQVEKTIQEPSSKQRSTDEKQPQTDSDQTQEEKQDSEHNENKPDIKAFLEDTLESTINYFTNNQIHVVAIGDSLTQGVGDTTDEGGYVGILDNTINQKKHLAEFDNYGKRGNRSDQLLKRLDIPEISASIKDADIITITIGANDIMKVLKDNITDLSYDDFREERTNYEKRLNRIFAKIDELNPDTKVYLIGFYNPYEKYFPEIKELGAIVKDWNTTGEKVANEYENATFIPTIDLFEDTNAELFADDNFHPNTSGYKLMARRVLEYLKP
ncbi:SGNH/GDSL hydrolase family protein [Lentibacillus sp. N15]|uniref:SGNH/GDSL hydrolase family protein n=1 Tax=Lentibacillus songyuanensis TaxID=3136161 RepID=UPI0031BA0150